MTAIGLWGIAGVTPDRTAVIEPDGGTVSYAELAALADRYGRGLQALGLRPGDTVAGQLPNSTRRSRSSSRRSRPGCTSCR